MLWLIPRERLQDISKFAELLKRTSLSSVIAVSELLISRFQFMDELRHLVYGAPARLVKERRNLHKIVEGHTWIFGEQFHLMSSDKSLQHVIPIIGKVVREVDDDEATVEVDPELRDVPDLYLLSTKWNEGARFHQHLIVEMKRPSVRIVPTHIQQLKRYASQIVTDPIFSQTPEKHQFTFVLISSQVASRVRTMEYQSNEEPGFIGRPAGLGHPTELWALQWSDYIDTRQEEMRYLRDQITLDANEEDLEYLRRTVGNLLPKQLVASTSDVSDLEDLVP